MSNTEQTLSIIKPDAVERNLTEEIKNIFLSNNFIIFKEKKIQISKSEAEEIYNCLLYTSPSPRDIRRSRMPSSA